MSAWLREIRYATRALRTNRGFTLAALLTMSVAIGATTGVFTIVDTVLFRPLPVPDSDRIVAVASVRRDAPARLQGASLEELQDWQRQAGTFAALCGWRDWPMVRYDGGATEGAFGAIMTPEFFQVFPMQPVLGRVFSAVDDIPGHNAVVLLGYDYWRQRFGADPGVVGKTMVLERGPKATYTIIGVLPKAINYVPSFEDVKIFAPSSIDPDAATGRDRRNRFVFARLGANASVPAAQGEMDLVAARLAQQYPKTNADRTIRVQRVVDYEVGPMADTLRSFLAAVGFVLLIACANVAGLQLVRALARRREFSIRQALGGSRAAIVRALVTESALLSLLAGVIGIIASRWLVEIVLASGPVIPRADAIQFDLRVSTFTFLLCLFSGLLLALPAALLTTRFDLVQALKEQSGNVAGAPALRARMLFVSAQIALALVLLTGAVTAGQTLMRQLTLNPGFDPAGIATTQIFPPVAHYRSGGQIAGLYARVLEDVRTVPGVRAASAVSSTPLSGEGREPQEFTVDGRSSSGARPEANAYNVAPGYFRTLDAPLRSGRDFGGEDTAASPHVAIVNDTFVRRYLPDRDPLRSALRFEDGDVVRVVGVSGDVLHSVGPRAAPEPEMYFPYTQRPRWAAMVVVRSTTATAGSVMALVRDHIRAIDPQIRAGTPVFMADRLTRSARAPRFVVLLFGVFAGVALLLSVVGVSGWVFYAFTQRTKEIAVRVSLGATGRDVRRLVSGGAFMAVLAGSVAGLSGTILLSRALESTLRQLDPLRPSGLAAAWALLVALGWLACYLPARRALTVDPADALRLE